MHLHKIFVFRRVRSVAKATISFVISVLLSLLLSVHLSVRSLVWPSVRLSSWNNSAPN